MTPSPIPTVGRLWTTFVLLAMVVGHAEQQRFEATVSRVRVDVIVQDSEGGFVDDLTVDDFRIFEDGSEQSILSVQMVDLPAGVLFDRSRSVTTSTPTDLVSNTDPSSGAPSERSGDFGAMVFVVDFQNLDFRNKLRFTEAWEDLIGQSDGLQIPRAVYLIDQVGRLEELAPLTQDPQTLLAAAEEVSNRSSVRKSLRDERIEESGPIDAMLRRYRDRDNAIYTYELLTQFAEGLSARPGRTALIWVSTGISLMYGDAYQNSSRRDTRSDDAGSPNPMILARQEAFHRAANSANVSVYTLDPTPKIEQVAGIADARFGPIGEDGVTPLGASNQMSYELDAIRNSLRQAAAETGGKAFIGWADLTDVLRDIEADTGRYYLLTYAAPQPEGDGEYHDIRVEVLRGNIDVRARDGYYYYVADDRRSRFVSAALSLPGTVADLPLKAQTTRSWSANGMASVMVSIALSAEEVGLSVDEDGVYAGLEVHAAVLNDRLETKEEHHGGLQRRLRRSSAMQLNALAGMPQINSLPRGELLVYRMEWVLPPDEYDIRVMVLDETTGRVGSARMFVEISEDEFSEWRTSDLLLIETDGANKARPVVNGRVPARRVVSAFLEVYNGVTPSVSGFIQAIDSAESALVDGVKIFYTPLDEDPDGIHRGAFILPPLSPGTFRLRLDIDDPGAAQETSLEANIEVLPAPVQR